MDFDNSTDTITPDLSTTLNLNGSVKVTGTLSQSTNASVTPAGTTQGTATAITAAFNLIPTSFTTANAGVILPEVVAGTKFEVINLGTVAVNIYPSLNCWFDGGSANAPVSLLSGQACTVISTGGTSGSPSVFITSGKTLVAGTNVTITASPGTLTVASSGSGGGGPTGPAGPTGPSGTNGVTGPTGPAGGGGSITKGTTTINFGPPPGTNVVKTTVLTGTIASTALVYAVIMYTAATTNHNIYEHMIAPIRLTCGNIVYNSSFDITAVTDLRLSGTFNVNWFIL